MKVFHVILKYNKSSYNECEVISKDLISYSKKMVSNVVLETLLEKLKYSRGNSIAE